MRAFILAAVLLAGCATHPVGPNGRPLTLADAGPPPADPKTVVRDVLKYQLRDFDSARIELDRAPRRVVMAGYPGGAGWELCPNVNAKNAYGGYTGYQRVFILWRNGKVLEFEDGHLGGTYCSGEKNSMRVAEDR